MHHSPVIANQSTFLQTRLALRLEVRILKICNHTFIKNNSKQSWKRENASLSRQLT